MLQDGIDFLPSLRVPLKCLDGCARLRLLQSEHSLVSMALC